MIKSYKKFETFQEPPASSFQGFRTWKVPEEVASLPVSAANYPLQNQQGWMNNRPNFQEQIPQYNQYTQQQPLPQYNPWQFQPLPVSNKISTPRAKTAKIKTGIWEDFKRIYITEVIAFTMSKSTLFTLIFSFMFLGCIFFLSGFFTATNIYREQHTAHQASRNHAPTETALLQGRPEKIVDMGAGTAFATPKAYQYQGGVKLDQNRRRPSAYVEKQIATSQPNYR